MSSPVLKYQIEVKEHPLGEIRMGSEGYGITLTCPGGEANALKNEVVLLTSSPQKDRVNLVACNDSHFVIEGTFATWIFNAADISWSLFRITVRDGGTWSEETPIFGSDRYHFNGENGRHYYVQFPFCRDSDCQELWKRYKALRIEQIRNLSKMT
jgi:hypothetical protein